jgi:hypothetical protein
MVQSVDIRIENDRLSAWTGGGGIEDMFSYVYIATLPPDASHIKVLMNNQIVWDQPLLNETNDTYTLPPSAMWTQQMTTLGINIPVKSSLLEPNNIVEIRLDNDTTWQLEPPSMIITMPYGPATSPVWSSWRYYLLGALAAEVAVASFIVKRFGSWARKIG